MSGYTPKIFIGEKTIYRLYRAFIYIITKSYKYTSPSSYPTLPIMGSVALVFKLHRVRSPISFSYTSSPLNNYLLHPYKFYIYIFTFTHVRPSQIFCYSRILSVNIPKFHVANLTLSLLSTQAYIYPEIFS